MLKKLVSKKLSYNDFIKESTTYVIGQPNVFLVENYIYVLYQRGDFDKISLLDDTADNFEYFLEDIYNKGFVCHKNNAPNTYIKDFAISKSKNFDPGEKQSYGDIHILKREFTLNVERLKQEKNIVYVYSKKSNKTYNIEYNEEIFSLYFEKGEKNKDIYFLKEEKIYLDGMIPYRKFNNIYSKPVVEGLQIPQNELSKIKNDNLKYGVSSLTYKAFEGIKYTYGLEIETIGGRISEEEVRNLNFKTVHDGSLRGPNGEDPLGAEYVTGVLTGDSGLTQLSEICRVIAKNCFIDKRCGVHVHVGNLNWNKEEIVYCYLLGQFLEKDLFSMLPVSRRENSYCRPLTKIITNQHLETLLNISKPMDYKLIIDELYDLIYKEVAYSSMNVPKDVITDIQINKRRNHPKGSKCGYDKKSQRYCWLNFVTLLFDTKGVPNSHTIEIRNHGGTMNFKKIRNWLKISFAFCRFVEQFKQDIINLNYKITVEHILSKVFPKTGKLLIDYVQERKELFKNHGESVDYVDSVVQEKQSIKEVVKCV